MWSAAPPSAPLLAQLLDSTPYAIAAAVVCVMLAIVVGSILATEKKRLSARPEVKSGGSWEEKVAVAHRCHQMACRIKVGRTATRPRPSSLSAPFLGLCAVPSDRNLRPHR